MQTLKQRIAENCKTIVDYNAELRKKLDARKTDLEAAAQEFNAALENLKKSKQYPDGMRRVTHGNASILVYK